MSCDLFIFAGEKSGDLHGERVVQELFNLNPQLKISGVGGPKMRAQRMDCILPMEEFQVMGFIDVFISLPKLIRQFYFVAKNIKRLEPKVFISIDYPGFNLRMAKHLKRKGFQGKCVHYICPSVWAWGKKRIPLMAKNLDLLLCILPFEKEIFAHTSLPVCYVGHPLVHRLKTYAYKPFLLPKDKKIIALFPGSRKKEIERNLPLYLDVCRSLLDKHKDLRLALSVSDKKYRPLIDAILKGKGWSFEEIDFIPLDYSYELMKTAYFAIAKSGTVTLELAMHCVPTIVTYGVSWLDQIIAYHILRIRLDYYCLVNIISQKQVFTELIGSRFNFSNMMKHVESLFHDESRTKIQNDCKELIIQLGNLDTAKEAAKQILSLT